MTDQHVDPDAVLAELKDFQRRTARWAFERMFANDDPAVRFLVADEVGLGKTHVAKGLIAQVIDHLQRAGDERHDIVYVCSNAAIARQNLRKLVPKGIEPVDDVERLTMLPLAQLNRGRRGQSTVNLLAITPGTSLKFGQSTGMFRERCLAYAFLRAHWGADVMISRARWIFWAGVTAGDPDARLRDKRRTYRAAVKRSLPEFSEVLAEVDLARTQRGQPTLRALFDELVDGLAWKRTFPDDLWRLRAELISEVRRVMAIVGIASLQPDLVVLDEFQRFKDLLQPDPSNFAAELAHRLFDYVEPDTGRPTRTLLLSATPYRMYTTSDDNDADHYADFLATCQFLFRHPARTERLQQHFGALRHALTSIESLGNAETVCADIGDELRSVMARTERLAATPDRDGMLDERDTVVAVEPDDLLSYLRLGDLAEAVDHHEPTEYWKAGPYLVNFMERYKLKEAIDHAAAEGLLADNDRLEPGPGLLSWADVEAYEQIDPQNGRLRWLLEDLHRHRAFDLLWIPASMRYYDTGSVYETTEAASFTKRLIFSGWALVPKVVSSLVSFEAERHAFRARSHHYTDDYRRRGGQRLAFRTAQRTTAETRPGEAAAPRRAAAMTSFILTWPSPSLAELGNPRDQLAETTPDVSTVLTAVRARLTAALDPLLAGAPTEGAIDQRWYWAAPLFLDQQRHPAATDLLLAPDSESHWEGESPGEGFIRHLNEARAMAAAGPIALGRPPDDLIDAVAELAVGGPAQCALRAIAQSTGLDVADETALADAARVGMSFRNFFNAPEVTGLITAEPEDPNVDDGVGRYWRDVVRHCVEGNLQAVLDEHTHVLRDWLGYLNLDDDDRRIDAADGIAISLAEALDVRTSSFRVDIPNPPNGRHEVSLDERRMRTRFAVAFGNQRLEDGGEARVESISTAFNSPFWPFVLTSTSVGQEGLDFHLWCHSVVHWNLPTNPVDLEQREGRVHRYKGHAVRRNIAATIPTDTPTENGDIWDQLFTTAVSHRHAGDNEMVPYWVFHDGPARIERHVPILPFSRDAAVLPQLRKTLAAYRLAFGQPRQDELIEFLGADRSDADLLALASRLRIDLTPPPLGTG